MHFSVFSFLFASVAMGYPFCKFQFPVQHKMTWPVIVCSLVQIGQQGTVFSDTILCFSK